MIPSSLLSPIPSSQSPSSSYFQYLKKTAGNVATFVQVTATNVVQEITSTLDALEDDEFEASDEERRLRHRQGRRNSEHEEGEDVILDSEDEGDNEIQGEKSNVSNDKNLISTIATNYDDKHEIVKSFEKCMSEESLDNGTKIAPAFSHPLQCFQSSSRVAYITSSLATNKPNTSNLNLKHQDTIHSISTNSISCNSTSTIFTETLKDVSKHNHDDNDEESQNSLVPAVDEDEMDGKSSGGFIQWSSTEDYKTATNSNDVPFNSTQFRSTLDATKIRKNIPNNSYESKKSTFSFETTSGSIATNQKESRQKDDMSYCTNMRIRPPMDGKSVAIMVSDNNTDDDDDYVFLWNLSTEETRSEKKSLSLSHEKYTAKVISNDPNHSFLRQAMIDSPPMSGNSTGSYLLLETTRTISNHHIQKK